MFLSIYPFRGGLKHTRKQRVHSKKETKEQLSRRFLSWLRALGKQIRRKYEQRWFLDSLVRCSCLVVRKFSCSTRAYIVLTWSEWVYVFLCCCISCIHEGFAVFRSKRCQNHYLYSYTYRKCSWKTKIEMSNEFQKG